MFVDLEKTMQWFEDYVRTFELSVPMIQMKYQHSLDVMHVGMELAEALNGSPEDQQLGIAACLLHDTGRFSQYRDFGTYYDGVSVDHGDRGYDVLQKEFTNTNLADQGAREVILQAVKWHNKKELPSGLPREALPFCRLVRDADKLDVFKLVQRRMDEGTVGELLPRHSIDAPLSPQLLDEVETYWSGSYKNASSLLDFLLIQLTWTLDINYAPSLKILEDSGVLHRIREVFPKDDARIQRVLDQLFKRMEQHKRAHSNPR